jgi:hypothetical protein
MVRTSELNESAILFNALARCRSVRIRFGQIDRCGFSDWYVRHPRQAQSELKLIL